MQIRERDIPCRAITVALAAWDSQIPPHLQTSLEQLEGWKDIKLLRTHLSECVCV